MATVTPAALREEVRAGIEAAREGLAAFLALPAGADFATLVEAFDRVRRPLDPCASRVALYSSVHPAEAVREAAEALERDVVAFETDLSLNRAVYERLAALDPATAPDAAAARLHALALRDYRRSGVDRDEATRTRIRALQEELVEVGQTFDRNIVKGRRSITVEDGHAGLAGLPRDYVEAHPEAEDGSVTITTDPTDFLPFMLYAERGDLRRRLHLEFQNRAHPENMAVLGRLLGLRHELATLLGYPSWAEYATEDKMVRDVATVRAFVKRIADLAAPRTRAEYAELLEEKRRDDPAAGAVHEWERGHLAERIKRRRFGFDSQAVRPYFAYEQVKRGVLAVTERLFGVAIVQRADVETWHPDVEVWDVLDGGERVARFHLDMFQREGKFKHAALFDVRHGLADGPLPEAALVCNFPRPTAEDPALLLHSQVTTFFHEFGHLLHHLFAGQARYLRFSGIRTEWDFVEVPSQLYEEWAWDPAVLASFALHVESGEPIAEEAVRAMRAAEEYGKGLHVAQQMFYARLSLGLYERDPAGLDSTALAKELREELTPFAHVEGTHFQAAFGHLHGYSAAYYTYMWSAVIAKDLLEAFGGALLDPARADEYRLKVLAPGGERDAAELVGDFLGRPYDSGAWERWLAL